MDRKNLMCTRRDCIYEEIPALKNPGICRESLRVAEYKSNNCIFLAATINCPQKEFAFQPTLAAVRLVPGKKFRSEVLTCAIIRW